MRLRRMGKGFMVCYGARTRLYLQLLIIRVVFAFVSVPCSSCSQAADRPLQRFVTCCVATGCTGSTVL